MTKKIKIGVLGAATITPFAIIQPSRKISNVEIYAIAARDINKASAFAKKHKIDKVHQTYDQLINDQSIDAIYNPLPNSHHCEWSIKALKAGKHVLCEKPISNNTKEAMEMKNVADDTGSLIMEAFHYRYHPLAGKMKQIIQSGELGKIKHFDARFCIPFLPKNNIRFSYNLGGGATMDTGCYTINMLRFLSGEEPEVIHAKAKLFKPEIDRVMTANFRFPSGASGHIQCALRGFVPFKSKIHVQGKKGEMKVFNPLAPHLYNRLKVKTASETRVEKIKGRSTYYYQLEAFAQMVLNNGQCKTDMDDAIKNMHIIDSVYQKAGLKKRGN